MNKSKQNLYTLLLIFTCFVASPFIFHKIWKTSDTAKKKVDVPPPSINISTQTSEITTAVENINQSTTDVISDSSAVQQTPTQAQEIVNTFATSDISYFNDALFIGDSRTVGIQDYGTLTNADFFCSVGLSSSNIENENINGMNFDQLIDSKQYGKVYVMLGINEVGNDFQYTITKYRAIIEKLKAHQSNAIIYIQANLHVTLSFENNVINNEGINYLNGLMAELADNKKVFYIDINEVYDDANGCLTEAYTSDGVHPLASYYKTWCDWLCTKTVVTDGSVSVSSPETAITVDPNVQ